MFQKKIDNMEKRFEMRPTVKTAVGLALRKWLVYAVSVVPEPREYLHRANHVILTRLRKNESDMRLFWLGIYFSIELGYFDKANEMLDNAYTYRAYYKSNQPFNYKILHFLYSYLEIKQKRAKSAKKHMRTLESAAGAFGSIDFDPKFDPLMMGMLHLAFYEYDEAYRYLARSYRAGCRSVFLFSALFNFYHTATARGRIMGESDSRMLLQTVHWALNHDADVEHIIVVYQNELLQKDHIALGERIYHQFPNQWMLKELCAHYMTIPDYGPKAYEYYRDAERRQIYLPNLSYFLVRAAFCSGAERIHRYTMTQYLRKPDEDIDLLTYVYHLLLTDESLSDLAANHVQSIIKVAAHCMNENIRSRYANSLYYFFWIKCNEQQIKGENVDRVEKVLLEDLYKFEVVFPVKNGDKTPVKNLYIDEQEKNGITEYEFPSDGSTLIINAVSNGFRYVGLSSSHTTVLEAGVTAPLEIYRRIASAGTALYRHFYDKNIRDFEIIAYLAKAYIQAISKGEYQQNQDWESVLEAVLVSKEASKAFKTQCSVALGELYYKKGQLEKALLCYDKADENALDDEFLEHMLTVYVKQQAFEAATGLVERKGHRIGVKVLFEALKPLSLQEHANRHPAIAKTAYELLLRSRYDKNLLEVVLAHFTGTQKQWLDLSQMLSSMSINEPRLAEIILNNAAWGHHFDEATQRVFVKMINDETAGESFKKCLQDFIYYAMYEIIIEKAKPLPETIAALEKTYIEKIHFKGEENLLAYGLCHVYLGHGVTTINSNTIIEAAVSYQKEKGMLFPIFRESKKKINAYIGKYRSFMYRTLPGKNVRLYYRVDEEEDWRVKDMDYWLFGLYMTYVPHFYDERLEYYFSEELLTGSITTQQEEVHNTDMYLDENSTDPFFIINNATIYEQMFRYEQVEEIIGGLVRDVKTVRSRLM
ncbi:MAG: DUF5717 family protein [Defluviitaleaceae bacterium]|nr:DUF5717 family protein [Defluviitaleaceae bacterium]